MGEYMQISAGCVMPQNDRSTLRQRPYLAGEEHNTSPLPQVNWPFLRPYLGSAVRMQVE